MKNVIASILLIFISATSFCQEISGVTVNKNTTKYSEDSDIRIRHLQPTNDIKNDVAVLINGDFLKNGYTLLKTINPNKIEAVNIEKGEITINEIKYFGKLLITLKPDYKPSVITLNNLIAKHLTLDDNPVILKIDNTYINQNFNEYIVDENYILQIDVTTVNTSKNDTINLIYIITKSAKNIENANQPKQIIIRGTE
ncbi:MAG: TonB-dependent receptor plug domain-containing protein [Flavobacteriaceae bacterium]